MAFFSKETEKSLTSRKALPGQTPPIDFVPTGIYMMDIAIGGGFPKKKVTEISGQNATAKTTSGIIAASKQIEQGNYVALIETENTLDLKWLVSLGIPEHEIYMGEKEKDIEKCHLHVWHPDYLESALETLLTLYKEDVYTLIILDSFGASPVRAAAEGTMEDRQMMMRARIGHQFKELFTANAYKGNAAVVMVNTVYLDLTQKFYDKLKPDGGKWASPGGESIPYLAGLRIFMYEPIQLAASASDKTIVGKKHSGMIFKNKTGKAVPADFEFRLMIVPYSYINVPWDIQEAAVYFDIVQKRGRFWFYEGVNVAGSEAEFQNKLLMDFEFCDEIERKIVSCIQAMGKEKQDGNQSESQDGDVELLQLGEGEEDQGLPSVESELPVSGS